MCLHFSEGVVPQYKELGLVMMMDSESNKKMFFKKPQMKMNSV